MARIMRWEDEWVVGRLTAIKKILQFSYFELGLLIFSSCISHLKVLYLRNVRPKKGVMFFPSGSSDNPNLASERRNFSR